MTLHFQHMTLERSGHVRVAFWAQPGSSSNADCGSYPGHKRNDIGGARHPGKFRPGSTLAVSRESTHGRERNYAQRWQYAAAQGNQREMTTSKVIFDPFAGDVFSDCMTRIVGSVAEESVYRDAQ
ncbi:hypothetical protein ACTXG5_19345 [Mycobacterium sp. Dal123C01]|uniref:hypothetical protein n=1 Tax=Mycobacterium sp. Dal123C01 TaxID=3457577 RepID=UPI00403EED03